MEGHLDWVRALDFSPTTSPDATELLLASGSQDGYIRFWSLIHLPASAQPEAAPALSAAPAPATGGAEKDGEILDDEMMDAFERKIAREEEDSGEGAGANGVGQVSMKAYTLTVKQKDGT